MSKNQTQTKFCFSRKNKIKKIQMILYLMNQKIIMLISYKTTNYNSKNK